MNRIIFSHSTVLIVTWIFFVYLIPQIHGASPYFPRQEITDATNDSIKLNYGSYTITPISNSNPIEREIASSIDMDSITYLSDGRTLNATLWLTNGFNATLFEYPFAINFGIYIDVNPESATGTEGVSYHKQIFWPSEYFPDLPSYVKLKSNISWIDNIHEERSGGGHRYLKIVETKNYRKLIEQEQLNGNVYSVPLSLDLKDMNFPHKYKVMFYISVHLNDYTRITDYSSWLDVPPANFYLSTVPNNLELRPEESRDITGILKSTTGAIPNVTSFKIDENNSVIRVHPSGISYSSSSSGVHPANFQIDIPPKDKIQAGEYTVPIAANISTGSTKAPPEFIGGKVFETSANSKGYMDTTANMTIKVLEPLGLDDRFKEFWVIYGQPISIVLGGFAGGAASLMFDRFKKKENSLHDDT